MTKLSLIIHLFNEFILIVKMKDNKIHYESKVIIMTKILPFYVKYQELFLYKKQKLQQV